MFFDLAKLNKPADDNTAFDYKSPVYVWIAPLESCAYKSLGYIIHIFNSQHGWIFIMVISNQYYDWGFQNCFSAMAIILSMDMIYSTMEGIVPSRCRLTTWHLGATLFKLRLHQICKSHVAASMHHDTWGLMQCHFYWPYWRPDSSHHNEPALGGYQLLLSTIQRYTNLIPLYWRVHYSVGKAQSS